MKILGNIRVTDHTEQASVLVASVAWRGYSEEITARSLTQICFRFGAEIGPKLSSGPRRKLSRPDCYVR